MTNSTQALTSPDGLSWTAHETHGFPGTASALAFQDGLFVAAGENGLFISLDGINWVTKSSGRFSLLSAGETALLAIGGYSHRFQILRSRKSISLTANVMGSGTVQITPDATAYYSGDQVTVHAVANPGNVFVGWAGSSSDTSPLLSFALTSDAVLSAHFKPFSLAWRQRHFTPSEIADGLSEGEVDSDGDGFDNYTEYRLAQDPRSRGSDTLPGLSVSTDGIQTSLNFSYRRIKGDLTLDYVVEGSNDLTVWEPAQVTQPGNPVDNGDGTETVTVQEALPSNTPRRFLRLHVNEK